MSQPPVAPRAISSAPIQKLDPKEFGKKAELKEKLVAILKDVPVLHERLTKLVSELEKANTEFRDATDRAKALVAEWEKLDKEENRQ